MQALKGLNRYVKQVLGVDADTSGWDQEAGLPFFLREAYRFSLLRLMGREFLLMVDRQKSETPPATIRKHMEQIRKMRPGEMIYVREQITAYNRNRLIRNQIPFIVPGNQLYLPMLAMDLRERFLTARPEVKKLSPATQAAVLFSIYEHCALFDEDVTLTEWARRLGYTKMTMTRAFRELLAILRDDEADFTGLRGKELWEQLRPFLRSPVRKHRFYVVQTDMTEPVLAGDSALAVYTMMAEPDHQTVCMTAERLRAFQQQAAPVELEQPEPGCLEVQIWTYDPNQFARNGAADPLSLCLSFEQNADERVEMALEKLLKDLSW